MPVRNVKVLSLQHLPEVLASKPLFRLTPCAERIRVDRLIAQSSQSIVEVESKGGQRPVRSVGDELLGPADEDFTPAAAPWLALGVRKRKAQDQKVDV